MVRFILSVFVFNLCQIGPGNQAGILTNYTLSNAWKSHELFDRLAYANRNWRYFLFSGLDHLSGLPLGHPRRPSDYNPTGSGQKFCRRPEHHNEGDYFSGNMIRTAHKVDPRGDWQDESTDYNPDGSKYCIFPSNSFQRKGVYLAPYLGALEYESDGRSHCYKGKDYYLYALLNQIELDQACEALRGRCLYNTYGSYNPEPHLALPESNKNYGSISSGGYFWHTYYSHADPVSVFAHCDAVIYVTMDHEGMNAKFGGYYMLEPPEIKMNALYSRESGGYSSYRHIKQQKFIVFHDYNYVWTTSDGGKFVMIKDWGDRSRFFSFRELNEVTGFTTTFIEAQVKDDSYGLQSYYKRHKEPIAEDTFCIRHLLASGKIPYEWSWTRENTFGQQAGTKGPKVNILVESGPPVRSSCGLGYRESENFAITSGKQPWVVYVLIGSSNPKEAAKCIGTILTVRHVLTAASCLCSTDPRYNVYEDGDPNSCAKGSEGADQYDFRRHRNGNPLKNVFVYLGERDVYGRRFEPNLFRVTWVSVHPSYRRLTGNYDVAVVGLMWNMQFSSVLMNICLPDLSASDTNMLPRGVLLYSIKALTRAESLRKIYTNANGLAIYEECKSPCFLSNHTQSLREWIKERGSESDAPLNLYQPICDQFWDDFDSNHRNAKDVFYKKWLEPQAIVMIERRNYSLPDGKQTYKCFDTRPSSYRFGWCKTKRSATDAKKQDRWGFCDDSVQLEANSPEGHEFYEVETTLVPGTDCAVNEGDNPDEIDRSQTKICTKYIPHKPSRYEIVRDDYTRGLIYNYTLTRYLGGYYRDFIPKIWRRKKKIKYDEFGEIIFSEDDAAYHSGFPRRHQVCHQGPPDIDIGGPSYFRMSRVKEQNPDTRDTTQEPAGAGVSHVVLVSIQTGWSGKHGKVCSEGDGYYTDVETVITREIHQWLLREISSLTHFSSIYNIRDHLFKVQNQETTDPTTQPTTSTTIKFVGGGEDSFNFDETTEFDYEAVGASSLTDDYFDQLYFNATLRKNAGQTKSKDSFVLWILSIFWQSKFLYSLK
ncbi:uncharacterized protein LOC131886277 isoform X2 [Tigriopus californicus]|uniref:uncharacterized protein LOC131886277 isoform X2 n=1 Tax=Tigriopus californicus TaxID=6832 RepID=UPI0027DAB0A5|nr:uncharacterized protein LOC131886277 isoform X2 [Tigriopus californicus]